MNFTPTRAHVAEAIHVTTNWRRYSPSYVTLCNRCLSLWGLT
jgi:hypothetical protein